MNFKRNERRGLLREVKNTRKNSPASIRNARDASLGVKGAKIFNLLPITLRNMNDPNLKVEDFKRELDNFLSMIPDEPTIPNRTRAADSNSLLHQIPMHMHMT